MGCVAPTMFGADDGRDRIAQTTTAFATSGATRGRIVAVRRPALTARAMLIPTLASKREAQ